MLAYILMEKVCTSQQLYKSFRPSGEPQILGRCSSNVVQFPVAFGKQSGRASVQAEKKNPATMKRPQSAEPCFSAAAHRGDYRAGQKQSLGSDSFCSCNT